MSTIVMAVRHSKRGVIVRSYTAKLTKPKNAEPARARHIGDVQLLLTKALASSDREPLRAGAAVREPL
jgi:hypothetical protein